MIALLVIHHAFNFWTWLGHFTGVSDESGPGYGFFSGIGSDLGEITLVGMGIAVILTLWRHFNCASNGCRGIGLHKLPGNADHHRFCHKCHPSERGIDKAEAHRLFHAHHEKKKAE